MSARPKMKASEQTDINGETTAKHARYSGQDIFVPDDPALDDRRSGEGTAGANRVEAVTPGSGLGNDLRIEKLTYVHQMLGELRKLSVTLNEPMVSYLLEMALLETDTALNVGQFRMELAGNGKIPV